MLQLSLMILTTLTLSLSYVSSSSLLLLSAVRHSASVWAPMERLTAVRNCMRLCRISYVVRLCRSSVVVFRYTRLDSFVVKTNCTFSLDDEFGGRFRITPLTHVHLSFNSPATTAHVFWKRVHNCPSRSSKVVDFGTNGKRVYDFLLVLNSNLSPILLRFRDIRAFVRRKPLFYTPTPIPAKISGFVMLIRHEITLEVFQPMRPRYLNVTDKQTDG